jgi:flagellar basal-body rod protein FlgF
MADGIYVSMCGAVARSAQLDGIADNLANAQTPGFKASRPAFEDFLPASGAPDKHYPAAVATALDLREGQLQQTGNPLDVLPDGGAFLAVRTPGGGIAYTRDGRLTLDAARRLVSGGNLVLSRQAVPIVVPDDLVPTIDQNGMVWGGGAQPDQHIELGELARVRLEGTVDRVAPSLVAPGAGGHAVPVDVPVHSGRIELGNGGALEAALQMVSAQRSFEASMQAIQTYRQMDAREADLGRIR